MLSPRLEPPERTCNLPRGASREALQEFVVVFCAEHFVAHQ